MHMLLLEIVLQKNLETPILYSILYIRYICVSNRSLGKRRDYFFAKIMLKFRKGFTIKVISLLVAITFTVTSTGYGIELSNKSHLRLPLSGSSAQGEQRQIEALGEILHEHVNNYIASQAEAQYKKFLQGQEDIPENRAAFYKSLLNYNGIAVMEIKDLYKNTGLLDHGGQGRFYGQPIIYIESSLGEKEILHILQHVYEELTSWIQRMKDDGFEGRPADWREHLIANYEIYQEVEAEFCRDAYTIPGEILREYKNRERENTLLRMIAELPRRDVVMAAGGIGIETALDSGITVPASVIASGYQVDEPNAFQIGENTFQVIMSNDLEAIAASSNNSGFYQRGEYLHSLIIPGNNGGGSTIFVANADVRLSEPIDRDNVWGQRRELHAMLLSGSEQGHQNGLDSLDILEIITRANMAKLGPWATREDVLRVYFENSQQRFEQTVETFLLVLSYGEGSEYDVHSYVPYNVSDSLYSHIIHFSWIYAVELKKLIEILEANPYREITVVDDATGFGHFIFSAAYVLRRMEESGKLPPGTLERIHFIGTDYKLKDTQFAIEATPNYPGLSVTWKLEDIERPGHPDRLKQLNNGRSVDLMVVNHVLEHLEGRSPADYIVDWLGVAGALVVAVPLEDSLQESISLHTHEFTEVGLQALAEEVEEMTREATSTDTSNLQVGMLIFEHNLADTVVSRSMALFGRETVQDIQGVYSAVWGRDAYRLKGEPIRGSAVSSTDILTTLLDIADQDVLGCRIARELAEALRYTRGAATAENFMRPIGPDMVRDIAERWRSNQNSIKTHLSGLYSSKDSFSVFENLWAEWSTYLDYIERAQNITGRDDVDSFEGIASNVIDLAMEREVNLTCAEIEKDIARQAHDEYEKADVVGLKTVNSLMRVQPEYIEQLLARGDWTRLLESAVLAMLYGEGKFYQSLQIYLELFVEAEIRQDFWNLVNAYVDALQSDYRVRRSLENVDFETLQIMTNRFITTAGYVNVPEGFDFDEAWLKKRQKKLRRAESHLSVVERTYAEHTTITTFTNEHPVDAYKKAMLSFLDDLDRANAGQGDLRKSLAEFRDRLIEARALSDRHYIHDYYFWTGAGEQVGQLNSRSLHPRYRLYQMEAYAERMFISAQLVMEELGGGTIQKEDITVAYQRHFNDEIALYTQEWIANYGPRRPAMFGYGALATIPENTQTLWQDAWIYQTRIRLIEAGADPELWGPASSGYTERLKYLLRDGDTASGDGRLGIVSGALEKLIQEQDVDGFTRAVRQVSPYDREDMIGNESPPAVTIGVHVHNEKPSEVFETLVHVREIDWPQHNRWSVLGTTSSKRDIAREEHLMALELGISRFGITNRQLLKAGNQNRVIPNTPRLRHGESLYLTLDDDYRPAPLTLQRTVPTMLQHPTVAFVQIPLFFRASLEPGHSIGRQMDAANMAEWSGVKVPAFDDLNASQKKSVKKAESKTQGRAEAKKRAGMSLPFGTNTLIRITPDKNFLEATGGFVLDPTKAVKGEDFATGAMSILMRTQPELFQEIQGTWTDGKFMSQVWIIGDGVDFAPGSQLQRQRWAEGAVQILFFIWLPHLFRSRGIGTLSWKSALSITTSLFGWIILSVSNVYSMIAFPLLAFTPFVARLSSGGGNTFFANILFLTIIPLAMRFYLYRTAGLTIRELYGTTIMMRYGNFFMGYLPGIFKGLLLRSGHAWGSFKGRQPSRRLKFVHFAFGLFQTVAGVYGVLQGAPAFAFCLLPATYFLYLAWRFHEQASGNQREKIIMMARDVQDTHWKRIARAISFPNDTLGSYIHSQYARFLWILWTSTVTIGQVAFMVHVIRSDFSVAAALATVLLNIAQLVLVFFRSFSLWVSIRGIKNRDMIAVFESKANIAPILAERIYQHATVREPIESNSLGTILAGTTMIAEDNQAASVQTVFTEEAQRMVAHEEVFFLGGASDPIEKSPEFSKTKVTYVLYDGNRLFEGKDLIKTMLEGIEELAESLGTYERLVIFVTTLGKAEIIKKHHKLSQYPVCVSNGLPMGARSNFTRILSNRDFKREGYLRLPKNYKELRRYLDEV